MARYTKKDADGRYYIESVNGKLESDKFGHTYGEAIDRFAELENADVAPRAEVAREICCKIEEEIVAALESNYRARKEHLERHAELAYDTELLLEINGKINALRGMEAFVEELKKKYAEDKPNDN